MKKILIITDSYNWATYFRAQNLKKYLKQYKIDITSFIDIQKYNLNIYDIVYITNWPIYGYIEKYLIKNKYKLVTGVSSHIGRKKALEMINFFRKFDSIGVSNKFLYNEFKETKLNIFYTPFGADEDIFFKKTNPSSFGNIFGWVGNSSRSVKRFGEVRKCFDDLGPEYQLKIVDQKDCLSHKDLCNFYNSVGTIICFSNSEGTPNPILEAAICGRWIISTNVGNIPELTKNIPEFTPVKTYLDLKQKIIETKSLNLDFLSKKVLKESSLGWTWKSQSLNFINLFE